MWVFGDLIHYQSGEVAILGVPFSRHGFEAVELCKRSKVVPKTVGEYIGWEDRHEIEIYGGDIVKAWIYSDAVQVLEVYNDRGCFVIDFVDADFDGCCVGNFIGMLEVIGNIHENQELLEDK